MSRFLGRDERTGEAASFSSSAKSAQRTEVDVQILARESECRFELLHSLVELQEREPEAFNLFVRQRATIHAADGLMLQNFPQQFYHGQHESRKTVFDMFWIGVDAVW